jgi:hypothetical protein
MEMVMSSIRKTLVAALGAVVVAGTLAACSGSPEVPDLRDKGGDNQGTDPVDRGDRGDIDLGDDGLVFRDGDDLVSFGGSLPAGFPDVPLLDLDVVFAGSGTTDGQTSHYVTMSGPAGSTEQLFEEAQRRLSSAGYNVSDVGNFSTSDGYTGWFQATGRYLINVVVSGDSSTTAVTYTIEEV